jgi:hypothetical protein
MKPCRDCGAPTAPSARSCPSCGILNPVLTWIALPNGEHLTRREPAGGSGGALAIAAPRAAVFTAPAAGARPADVFGQDRLASWAVWLVVFAVLRTVLVGGAIGGLIAAVISIPVGMALPTRADGRKLPAWLSFALIVGCFLYIFSGLLVLLLLAISRPA